MGLRSIVLLLYVLNSGYFVRSGTQWSQGATQDPQDHCPSSNHLTNECYELVVRTRICVSYVTECCNGEETIGICKLCRRLSHRPCLLYKCVCCEGWYEDVTGRCLFDEDSAKLTCQNGGVPFEEDDSEVCICPEDFEGDRCETPICAGECQNDGRCEVMDGIPQCMCPSKYFTGNFCEEVVCEKECQNGGQCVKDGVLTRCLCEAGYRGSACEVLSSESCPIIPDDLKDPKCKSTSHQCVNDYNCRKSLSNHVCCWNGCAGMCKTPDDVRCHINDQTFYVGVIYYETPCLVCVCQPSGQMICEHANCTQSVSCPDGVEPVEIEGQCCKRCPGKETGLPPAPTFKECPRHYVEAFAQRYENIAVLPNLNLEATDSEGFQLAVFYTQTLFHHSGKSDIYTNTYVTLAYSDPDKYGRRAECQIKVIVKDKYSPEFRSCPVNLVRYEGDIIRWTPPVPYDNVGISQVLVSGDEYMNKTLRHGSYPVSYTALDFEQNKAICAFEIYSLINVRNYQDENPYASADGIPAGTIVGLSVGILMMSIFTLWLCVRIRHQQQAEAEERAAETDTLASTAETGENETVFAMCDRVISMYNNVKDIKLPDYSPAADPPSYDELTNTDKSTGKGQEVCAASLPIYEEIPERAVKDEKAKLDPPYENMPNGIQNPAYANVTGDEKSGVHGQNLDNLK